MISSNQLGKVRYYYLLLFVTVCNLLSIIEIKVLMKFSELNKLKNKLGLSDSIVEKTAYIYRKAEKRGIIRGRTIHSLLAASLYIACREMVAPKTLKEIARAGDIRLKTLSKDYRMLLTELDLKVPNNDLMHYVFKVGNALPTSEKTKRNAIELMDFINKKDRHTYTSGKDPMGLAATVLFVASANNDENMTQGDSQCCRIDCCNNKVQTKGD